MSHEKKEMISVYLTTRCNLDCIYCYTNKNTDPHKFQTLDFEFAKAGIDDYYQSGFAHHIRFFGAGEPTVELELLKKILAYAKEKDPLTTSEIQTNGCFNIEIAQWLSKNIDIIWISCDGLPEVQDHYRPMLGGKGSSEVLARNIRFLTSSKHEGITGVRTTITNSNVKHQIDMIKYFANLGAKNFWADPIFPSIGEQEALEEVDMVTFANSFVAASKYAYSKGMTYGSILTCNMDEPGEYACRACLPVPHLTTDGYVSACDMALFGSDSNHMDVFIYGKWDENTKTIQYDNEKIELLQSRKLSNLRHCRDCEAGEFCRGYCLGEVVNEHDNLFGCKQKVCVPIRIILNALSIDEKKYVFTHP